MIANWKMNHQSIGDIRHFFERFGQQLENEGGGNGEEWKNGHVGIAPQFIHIPLLQDLAKTILRKKMKIHIGAQNSSHATSGALTGEVSPQALKELGVDFVIIGHSERRQIFSEDDSILDKKLHQAQRQGLTVLFCVGEILEEREAKQTIPVIERQLRPLRGRGKGGGGGGGGGGPKLLIAYEPVWAIGTGQSATPEEAQEVHAFIRHHLEKAHGMPPSSFSLLYGGSVKPSNAKELLAQRDVEGALVGGASLDPGDFFTLVKLLTEV